MAMLVLPSGELTQIEDHLDRIRRLLVDVEALASGRHPTKALLASAPVIENWALASRPLPCLTGQFLGHPTIRSGRAGRTSDIWIHAPSLGYTRTLSRFYRLGDPAPVIGGSGR